jgi:hypothetical protein
MSVLRKASGLTFFLMAAAGVASAQSFNSPATQIPVGSFIVVKQRLPVAPEYTWVFVQSGKLSSWTELRHWYPFCRFEVAGLVPRERYIEPGRYRVTRAVGENRTVDLDLQGPGQSQAIKVQSGGGGAPNIIYRSHFDLSSPDHPEVRRLSCQEQFVMMDTESGYVSLAKIRQALGELAEVRLPE